MRLVLSVVLGLMPLAVAADGFAVGDLSALHVDVDAFAGGTYEVQQSKKHLLLACVTCDDLTTVHALIGRAPDDTEARFRAGTTTVRNMHERCRQNDQSCTLTALEIGGAVGWVSQYTLGPNEGSTAIFFHDGDMLTIRSLSESRNRAGSNMAAALRHIAPQILED